MIYLTVVRGIKKFFGKQKHTKTPKSEGIVAVEQVPEPIVSPVQESRGDEVMNLTDEASVANDEATMVSEYPKNDTTVDEQSIMSNASKDETVYTTYTQKTEKTLQTEHVDETDEREEIDEIKYQRVNTLTADITLPVGAKEGDFIDIDHDGMKKIRIPVGQKPGDSILVKMISNANLEDEQPATPFCGCF